MTPEERRRLRRQAHGLSHCRIRGCSLGYTPGWFREHTRTRIHQDALARRRHH